jgi:hypothetical protein
MQPAVVPRSKWLKEKKREFLAGGQPLLVAVKVEILIRLK